MEEVSKQLKEITRQHPELHTTKSIRLTPEFVQMMEEVPRFKGILAVGEQEFPTGLARILGTVQQLALLSRLTPEMKMATYFFLASYYANLEDFFPWPCSPKGNRFQTISRRSENRTRVF